MTGSRAFLAAMLLLSFGAFVLRVVDIGNRPMHGDEAVHAEKFRDLWEKHVYRYDSNEYHGPTIYYAALPSVVLAGRHTWQDTQEADYRLPIAVFGAVMVLLLLPLAPSLGRGSTFIAGMFIAASPAFVFYSRYFIQEVPFVFFTLMMIACGWRYAKTHGTGWIVLTGIAAGLMIATKETAVLSFAAALAAIYLTTQHTRLLDSVRLNLTPLLDPKTIAVAVSIAALVSCALISGFGSNLHGPLDYLGAYTPWFHRAQGASIQNHPFGYYLGILVWTHRVIGKSIGGIWSEGLIVGLSAIGAIYALLAKRVSDGTSVVLWRFIAYYTITLTLIYSIIPYKTPWCLLSFLLGMCLLAGLGVVSVLNALPAWQLKIPVVVLLAAAYIQLVNQAYRASFTSNADPHNPYVYAATAADITHLQKRIDDLAIYWPQHRNMTIKVFAPDSYYWPLPWYLRRYPNVGYYSRVAATKQEAAAEVTLCEASLDEPMSTLLDDADLMNGLDEVRNGVFYEVFIRTDVWTTYLNGKNGGVVRKFVPPPPAE